jgi:hypothetical protein
VIVSAIDIVSVLREHGYSTPTSVAHWLQSEFPRLPDARP